MRSPQPGRWGLPAVIATADALQPFAQDDPAGTIGPHTVIAIAAITDQPLRWLATSSFHALDGHHPGRQAVRTMHAPFPRISARVGVVDGLWRTRLDRNPGARTPAIYRSRGRRGGESFAPDPILLVTLAQR